MINITRNLLSRTNNVNSLKKNLFNQFSNKKNYCTKKFSVTSDFDLLPKYLIKTNYRLLSFDSSNKLIKKRLPRINRSAELEDNSKFNVKAFATAEEYNLEGLVAGLVKQNLYEPKRFFSTDELAVEPDVLYVKAKYKVEEESRDIFFFREGTVVLWNISDMESNNVLAFLKSYEKDRYDENFVLSESEQMPYDYNSDNQGRPFLRNSHFYLTNDQHNQDTYLEKYTFSNALSLSVKLGIWEASLDKYVESMEYVTNDLKNGKKIKITRDEMLRKTGELFALKHLINLSSDLLDTPDFYWDREDYEKLYSKTCAYFSIPRRTNVMNEKLAHCIELAELISSNLNDKHHVRLEWMIIILIMVEVFFEIVHYGERFFDRDESQHDLKLNQQIDLYDDAISILRKNQINT